MGICSVSGTHHIINGSGVSSNHYRISANLILLNLNCFSNRLFNINPKIPYYESFVIRAFVSPTCEKKCSSWGILGGSLRYTIPPSPQNATQEKLDMFLKVLVINLFWSVSRQSCGFLNLSVFSWFLVWSYGQWCKKKTLKVIFLP